MSLVAATWDSPPRPGEPGYDSFTKAFEGYVRARAVKIPKYTEAELRQIGDRPEDEYRLRHRLRSAADLQLGQKSELRLLPFQVSRIQVFVLHPISQGADRSMDSIGLTIIGGTISHVFWRMKWVWLVLCCATTVAPTNFTGKNRPNCHFLG